MVVMDKDCQPKGKVNGEGRKEETESKEETGAKTNCRSERPEEGADDDSATLGRVW
jgi:hypothetical protein